MQPPDIRHTLRVDDGTVVTLRPIRPEDREIEDRFVRELSEDSRYFRFLAALKELTPRQLDRFTNPDFPRELALIATVVESGSETEIGVARYAASGSDGAAEFAIVVADRWQGLGIGRALLQHLFDAAAKSGYRRIEGIVLKSNSGMLDLCREVGFRIMPFEDDASLVRVGLEIGAGAM